MTVSSDNGDGGVLLFLAESPAFVTIFANSSFVLPSDRQQCFAVPFVEFFNFNR